MTPLDAWHIVSANLNSLYKMRKTAAFKGYVDVETEAEVVCFKALQEMEDRENPKLLTIAELKQMHGQPVWVADESVWGIVNIDDYGQFAGMPFVTFYWRGVRCDWNIERRKLKCYRYKTKEETK